MKIIKYLVLALSLIIAFSVSIFSQTPACTLYVNPNYDEEYQYPNGLSWWNGDTPGGNAYPDFVTAFENPPSQCTTEVYVYVYTGGNYFSGDLYLNGDFIIEDESLIISGNVYLYGDAKLRGGHLIVSGTFYFVNSILDIGDNNLTVDGGFDGQGDEHFIETSGTGEVYTPSSADPIPVGNQGPNNYGYTPVIIQSGGDEVFAVKSEEEPTFIDEDAKAINVQWEIRPAGEGSVEATLSFIYPKAACPPGFDPNTARVYHKVGNNWVPYDNCVTQSWPNNLPGDPFYITTVEGVTSFSPHSIASSGPIPLFSFWHFMIAGLIVVLLGMFFVYKKFL